MSDPIRSALGEEAFRLLELWQQSTNRLVRPAGRPLAGLSGAALLPVRVEDAGELKAGLIKYCPPEPGEAAREPGAHATALRVSPPRFAEEHLVGLLYDPIVMDGGGMLLFQRIASGSLTDHVALRGYGDNPAIGSIIREIVRSVLADWNAPDGRGRLGTRGVSPGEFLAGVLDYRLRPGHRLTRWLEGQPDIARPRSLYLSLPHIAEALVNPIALITGANGTDRLRLPLTTGLAHGDLHVDNVIVPGHAPDPGDFRLIDLSTFHLEAPLARDPIHLLLSVVDLHLPALGPVQRMRLADVLVNDTAAVQLPVPLAAAVEAVRAGGADAYEIGERRDDWQAERLMALAACALMYVPRAHPADPQTAWWYFTLAAQAATRYLAEATGETPKTRPVPVVRKDGPTVATPAADPSPAPSRSEQQALTFEQRESLVAAILAVPYLSSVSRLDRIVAELPREISVALAFDSNDSLQYRVVNLIAVLDRFPQLKPWPTLTGAIRLHNGPGPELDRLAELISEVRP